MLAEWGEDASVLAGGQSLVPMLNLRLARPSALVDVGRVAALSGISANGALRLGATTRQADALRSAVVAERAPLLAEALRHVGHPATRSRGTVGGSIAHADPAAELPAVLLALDGEAIVASAGGERAIPAAVAVPRPVRDRARRGRAADGAAASRQHLPAARFGFAEIARRRGDFALAGAAVAVAPGPCARRALRRRARAPSAPPRRSGRWRRAPAPRRRRSSRPRPRSPSDDPHATADYRREAARVATLRALLGRGGRAWLMSAPCASRERPRARGLAEPRTLLSDFLRHGLGLTGTHVGCEHGACGACTVLVDGRPALSCLVLAVQAEGAEVLTVEGLADEDGLHPIQQAFRERHGLQCGFCTPGMLLAAKALLDEVPDPSEDEIRDHLAGNVCRCTGYVGIVEAVHVAAQALAGGGAMTGRYVGARVMRVEDPALPRGPWRLPRRHRACRARCTSPSAAAPTRTRASSRSTARGRARSKASRSSSAARTCATCRRSRRPSPRGRRPRPARGHMLPLDRVRFVGEAVAAVVARSRARRRGRGRADRRRVRAAARGARRRGRARAGRARPARRAGRQQLRAHRVRGGRRRRRVRRRRARLPQALPLRPHARGAARGPRRDRRLGRGRGLGDGLDVDADAVPRARHAGGAVRPAGHARARDLPGRRRRLRPQGAAVRRGGDHPGAVAPPRARRSSGSRTATRHSPRAGTPRRSSASSSWRPTPTAASSPCGATTSATAAPTSRIRGRA